MPPRSTRSDTLVPSAPLVRVVIRHCGSRGALADIKLAGQAGGRRAVLGSNGAGKTTLFNAITGDFLPTTGRVRLFGEDVTDLATHERVRRGLRRTYQISQLFGGLKVIDNIYLACRGASRGRFFRSEEHTSELQSLMRISYAVFCLKKK